MAPPNPNRQRAAREKLEDIFGHPASAHVIHYACQSFDQDAEAGSPRVTAIGVRNLGTGETNSFSVHQEAELRGLGPVQVLSQLDELEYSLLAKFFGFLQQNRKMKFLHWNMRDALYGFAAIEHRYSVLGGEAYSLPESQRYDLARLFVDIYGTRYARAPYLRGLADSNGLALTGYLDGPVEAEAFERGQYGSVERSVLVKVRLLNDIVYLAHDRTLKTRAGWWTLNRGRVREAYEMFERNPVVAVGAVLITAFGIVLKVLEYTGI